jgi:hypothetical protein
VSGKQVKRFRKDGGGEYTSKKFAEYLQSEGILQEMTTPYTPQSNRVIKLVNRTIMERVQSMLDHAGLSQMYWAFAVSVVVYLKNCTPTRWVVGKTVYKAWHGRKPSLKHLRVFGCLAFVHVPKDEASWITEPLPAYSLGTAYQLSSTSYTIQWPGRFTALEMWYTEKGCGTQH